MECRSSNCQRKTPFFWEEKKNSIWENQRGRHHRLGPCPRYTGIVQYAAIIVPPDDLPPRNRWRVSILIRRWMGEQTIRARHWGGGGVRPISSFWSVRWRREDWLARAAHRPDELDPHVSLNGLSELAREQRCMGSKYTRAGFGMIHIAALNPWRSARAWYLSKKATRRQLSVKKSETRAGLVPVLALQSLGQ
jgi:hypothetical protein